MTQSENDLANRTIAIESSTWNNIGDAFYQNSLVSLFKELYPDYNIVTFDGPFERAFRPGKHAKNAFDSRPLTDAAHYVLSGPILGVTFPKHYGPLIKMIKERGRSYSLLSMHCNAEGENLKRNRELLKQYPPSAIHTRDHLTYEKIKDLAPVTIDGICFAFFVSRMKGLPILNQGAPYLCSSYYRTWEPTFGSVSKDAANIVDSGLTVEMPKKIGGLQWKVSRLFEYKRPAITELGPWKIIRPVHAFSPLPQLIFSKPNSYISYNPENFLAIYKYCAGVMTDRVHAGVAAMSFGHPAMVSAIDTRFTLFDKVPFKERNGFMWLDHGALDPYFEEITNWLTGDYAREANLVPGPAVAA